MAKEGRDARAREGDSFIAEVARVQAGGALGQAGRLRELFDYLAGRGPDAAPASQAEIADSVFGQPDTEGDDATARVYVHRLRKRLEEFYAAHGEGPDGARLVLPAGTYALRLSEQAMPGIPIPTQPLRRSQKARAIAYGLALAAALGIAMLAGRLLPRANEAPPVNAFWQPFLESDRPIVIVVGDYYLFGEIDPVRPEQGRLIRDFRVDSPTELASLQEAEPERYGRAEDVGLTYLPLSTAYALRHVVPVLARGGREVRIIASSELHADTAREANIVYVGLFSGLGLLEDTTFAGSGFAVGESYDELIDRATRRTYMSEEARRLASPVFYRDYGYVARFEAPGGTLVAVVAGARDTALRGVAPIVSGGDLPDRMATLTDDNQAFEALFQITGQQGADLSERLLVARTRRRP